MRRFVLKTDTTSARALAIDYAEELNPQQYDVVTSPGGASLVVAGAGTGKTRTLVYRVAYLVETGTPPEEIVLLTFTRRSAQEMLVRASALLDGRCSRVRGGTFHSFCLSVLRRHASRIGFESNFSILDSADAADVIDVLRTARGFHRGERRFPRKKAIHGMFSSVANRGIPLDELVTTRYPHFLAFIDDLRELHSAFEEYKRQHGLMDYDDLLARTVELFMADDAVRRQVAAGCRHVLVDEYQDTNRLQAELVRQFATVHGNVMAVGDDAQSIYRFRGADFRNILEFPEHFPRARVLKLEQNYRSTQPILDLANFLIGKAHRRYDKRLFTENEGGERPAVVPAPDDRYESRFVVQMILQLREEGVALNRMAVLFRSSFNSYDLEVALNQAGIPFVKYGGLKLSEAAHVKDVTAHLRVAENPRDAVSWNRILQLLPGVGPKTAGDVVARVTAGGDPFDFDPRALPARQEDRAAQLFEVLRFIRGEGIPVVRQVETVVEYFEPILREKYYEDYPKRQQDLDHFVALADGYASRSELLSSMALDPIELTAVDAEAVQEDEPPLVLSTIHSAKGLEFHSVFLIHALDGVLPSGYALDDVDALDEELRLLYVAITRAERNLFISYPILQYRRFRGEYFSNPSRFIEDVPEQLLEEWQLVEEPAPAAPPAGSEAGPSAGSQASLPAGSEAGSEAAPRSGFEAPIADEPAEAGPSKLARPEADDGLPF